METSDAISSIVNIIKRSLDNGIKCIGTLLNPFMALDSIHHAYLSEKPKNIGILGRDLNLINRSVRNITFSQNSK